MKDEKQSSVCIRLSKDSGVKKTENLFAYVVDQSGKIVESAPFKEMEATLRSTKSIIEGQSKVYIAQEIPKQLALKSNERMLIKAGAYQVAKNFKNNTIIVNRIPDIILKPWHHGNCLVTGNITNTVTIDGKEMTGPVCHARVHLVEVETELIFPYIPILYRRIPDWVINEIRQKILVPPPIPDPIGPVSMAEKIDVPPSSFAMKSSLRQSSRMEYLPPLPEHVRSGLASPLPDTVRQTMADNHHLLHPYLCMWPIFWPWIYEWDEDNIVYTDSNGHFEYWEDTTTEDGPLNIYTWVEVQINGQWATVYHPSMPCHTWWNYPCGTPINISLHDPRIVPCVTDPLPGRIVWIKRIGNGTSIRNIALHTVDVNKPSLFADARGLTNSTGIEGGNFVSPFSGSFPIYIQFGDGFPSANVTHFRWKYRRIADADLTPISEVFKKQEGTLTKHYTYQGTDIHGHTVFYGGDFPLDVTLGSGKVYKIPHVDASVDTGIATAQWNQETVSINVDALSLQNGLYEFVLELCDNAGAAVNIGSDVYQIDSFLPSPPNPASVPAKDIDPQYVIMSGTQAAGFRFVMRIDNDHTSCGIYNAMVLNQNGTTATTDTACGFAQYEGEPISPPDPLNPGKQQPKANDKMLLRFFARQPHRFARFDYSVKRGNSSFVVIEGGQTPEPVHMVFAGGSWINYQYNPALTSLLGTCEKGAFAENLYLHAYHTNGTVRLDGYDSSAVAAFAIEPQR